MSPIATGRVYETREPSGPSDAVAVLCDRLWPRGLRKEDLSGVLWMKEWAPTGPLRQDFHAGRISPVLFRDRYRDELEARRETILRDLAPMGSTGTSPGKPLLLLTASWEIERSHLPLLRDYLEELLVPRPTP